eukprot:6201304-Pleurochrysis_carterae.AAC.2
MTEQPRGLSFQAACFRHATSGLARANNPPFLPPYGAGPQGGCRQRLRPLGSRHRWLLHLAAAALSNDSGEAESTRILSAT